MHMGVMGKAPESSLQVSAVDSTIGTMKFRPETATERQPFLLRKPLRDTTAKLETTVSQEQTTGLKEAVHSKTEITGAKEESAVSEKETVEEEVVGDSSPDYNRNHGEARVNKEFFDSHANVGVMDNCSWKERDTTQCPFNSCHRFGTRKEDHIDQCARARNYGKRLAECHYNRFHRLFPHQEADHYRFCATFLLHKARYRYNFPSLPDFEQLKIEMGVADVSNWTYEEYLEFCKDRLFNPTKINGEKNFDWFERNITTRNFFMGFILLEPLCKVVIAEGKKLREEEARNPLPSVPNFYNRRRPRLLMPIKPQEEDDPEFVHLSVKPIKKTPDYIRPPRDSWDEDEFFRTEVDYKAPVRQRFLSDLGWAYFDYMTERKRTEEETGVTLPRADPDKWVMEHWLPKKIKEKEEAART